MGFGSTQPISPLPLDRAVGNPKPTGWRIHVKPPDKDVPKDGTQNGTLVKETKD